MIDLLKQQLEAFSELEHLNLTVYFLMKNSDVKLADIADADLPDLKKLYLNYMDKSIIGKEGLSMKALSEADQRKDVIYKYDFDKTIPPFSQIAFIEKNEAVPKFDFQEDELSEIDAFICRIANSKDNIYFFTKVFPMNLIKRGTTFLLAKSQTRFNKFDSEILRISGKFDLIMYNEEYYLLNYDIIEKYYHFDSVVKAKALEYRASIASLNIVSDLGKVDELIETNTTFARKLVKVASSSPVISMAVKQEKILSFAKGHALLSNKLKFTDDDKIIVDSKNRCQYFLKLLDDDFLKSLLTELDYDSSAKDKVNV